MGERSRRSHRLSTISIVIADTSTFSPRYKAYCRQVALRTLPTAGHDSTAWVERELRKYLALISDCF